MQRRRYELEIFNSKLKTMKPNEEIVHFFNFDTEEIKVTSKGSYFTLKVEHCEKVFYFEPVEEHSKASIV